MAHDVYFNHNWSTVGCRQAQRVLLRWLPGWKWTFNNGPQQHVTTKTTDSKYDTVFRKSDNHWIWFKHKISNPWDRQKRSWFMKYVGNLDFDEIFVEVGMNQIGSFSKQMECDMIYQLSLMRSFFPTLTNFLSNLKTLEKMLAYLYLLWYIPSNCWSCSYWYVA